MRSGRVSEDVALEWLTLFLSKPTWAGLVSSDPYAAVDPLALEVTGSVYARARMTWERTGLLLRNAAPINWLGIPPMNQVAAIAGFDAAFNGRLRWAVYLPKPRRFPGGGQFGIAKGELYLGIDA